MRVAAQGLQNLDQHWWEDRSSGRRSPRRTTAVGAELLVCINVRLRPRRARIAADMACLGKFTEDRCFGVLKRVALSTHCRSIRVANPSRVSAVQVFVDRGLAAVVMCRGPNVNGLVGLHDTLRSAG
jgi:hypothetical protein